ncbi:hypothetical protein CJP74_07475 [Psittacicella melopsittaci]|uniref:Major facilitator superfamily (MFS) profile domain-containing protein n=1 Tax=Psittacicella melopsittaci TaxID=2028576 RepID=A0A3A1XZC8_9GAMM|nr:MFS transporter [Psittacicella melopsittaci]RIY31382.1 hypothetical protein CJP74_07475 [Psittacicella melopsittaci]
MLSQTSREPDYDSLSSHQKKLREKLPKRWLLIVILTLLSIIPGFENTSFSPAIGQLKEQFHVNIIALQAFYLLGMGIGQLFWGPMIDNWGRKPILIICAVLGILTNLSIVNVTVSWGLYLNRICQGFCFGGLGLLSTIILKDIYPPRRFVIYNSWIVLFFMCSPALGPLWGGNITVVYGWRMIFNILTVGLVISLVIYLFSIPETIAAKYKHEYDLNKTLHLYAYILANARARYLIFFNVGRSFCIFSLPVLVPNILINEFSVDPDHIGYYFIIPIVFTVIGNRLNVYLMQKGYSPRNVWVNASILQAVCTIVNLIVSAYFLGPLGIILCFSLNFFFNGFQLGNISSLYLMIFPEFTATANAFMTFLKFVIPSILVFIIALFPDRHGVTLLVTDGLITIVLALFTIFYVSKYKPFVSREIDEFEKQTQLEVDTQEQSLPPCHNDKTLKKIKLHSKQMLEDHLPQMLEELDEQAWEKHHNITKKDK